MMRIFDDEYIFSSFLKGQLREVREEEQKKKEEEIARILQEKDDEMANLAKEKDNEMANLAREKDDEMANLARENAANTASLVLNLKNNSNVSITTAMDLLGIPASERPALLAMM